MAQGQGLVGSFLNAFQGLVDIHRQQEQDKQAQVKFAVDTELRKQEAENEKIFREKQLKQQENAAQRQEEANRIAQQKADTQEAAQRSTEEHQRQQEKEKEESTKRLEGKNKRDAYVRLFHELYSGGTLTGKQAMLGAQMQSGYQPTSQDTSEIGQFGQSVGGQAWMDQPNNLATMRGTLIGSQIVKTDLQNQKLKILNQYAGELEKAKITAAADKHTKEAYLNSIAPEKWRQKKLIDKGRLDVANMNAETNRLRLQVQQRGQDATTARAQLKDITGVLSHIVSFTGTQAKSAISEHEKALEASKYATSEMQALKAKKDLTPAEQDLLLKMQGLHNSYNEKDKSGKSRLDYLAEARTKAVREASEAQAAAKNAASVNQTSIDLKGGFIPTKQPSAAFKRLSPKDKGLAPAPAVVKVKTPDEARKLKPGTHYVTPDGREIVR